MYFTAVLHKTYYQTIFEIICFQLSLDIWRSNNIKTKFYYKTQDKAVNSKNNIFL